jgi:hypothetical protein
MDARSRTSRGIPSGAIAPHLARSLGEGEALPQLFLAAWSQSAERAVAQCAAIQGLVVIARSSGVLHKTPANAGVFAVLGRKDSDFAPSVDHGVTGAAGGALSAIRPAGRSVPFDFLFLSQFVFFLTDFTEGGQLFGFCLVVFPFELFDDFSDDPGLRCCRAGPIVDTPAPRECRRHHRCEQQGNTQRSTGSRHVITSAGAAARLSVTPVPAKDRRTFLPRETYQPLFCQSNRGLSIRTTGKKSETCLDLGVHRYEPLVHAKAGLIPVWTSGTGGFPGPSGLKYRTYTGETDD